MAEPGIPAAWGKTAEKVAAAQGEAARVHASLPTQQPPPSNQSTAGLPPLFAILEALRNPAAWEAVATRYNVPAEVLRQWHHAFVAAAEAPAASANVTSAPQPAKMAGVAKPSSCSCGAHAGARSGHY